MVESVLNLILSFLIPFILDSVSISILNVVNLINLVNLVDMGSIARSYRSSIDAVLDFEWNWMSFYSGIELKNINSVVMKIPSKAWIGDLGSRRSRH